MPGRDGAVRIDVRARAGRDRDRGAALTPRALPIVLTPYVLPGGLGEHKWVDRRLLDALGGRDDAAAARRRRHGARGRRGRSVLVRRDGRPLHAARGRADPAEHVAARTPSRPTSGCEPGDELLLSSSSRESCRPCSRPPARHRAPVRVVLRSELLPERRLLVAAHERDEDATISTRGVDEQPALPEQQRLADDARRRRPRTSGCGRSGRARRRPGAASARPAPASRPLAHEARERVQQHAPPTPRATTAPSARSRSQRGLGLPAGEPPRHDTGDDARGEGEEQGAAGGGGGGSHAYTVSRKPVTLRRRPSSATVREVDAARDRPVGARAASTRSARRRCARPARRPARSGGRGTAPGRRRSSPRSRPRPRRTSAGRGSARPR